MTKLLNTFRAAPTEANRRKLQAYLNKHMMALCMARPEDIEFLRINNFSI